VSVELIKGSAPAGELGEGDAGPAGEGRVVVVFHDWGVPERAVRARPKTLGELDGAAEPVRGGRGEFLWVAAFAVLVGTAAALDLTGAVLTGTVVGVALLAMRSGWLALATGMRGGKRAGGRHRMRRAAGWDQRDGRA
jgi:hypothetical protein